VADDIASFIRKIDKYADFALDDKALRKIGDMAGMRAKMIATAAASADLGGDPKFSGWKPTLDTRFDHIRPGAISFHPTKSSAGPWTVAEFGRHSAAGPQLHGVKLTKSGKVSKGKGKRWNGRTAGKHTASEALAKMNRELPALADKEVSSAVRKFFN
jgi:hypothetical protein